ncbi:Aste57867_16854 [Aphanomyces stellatus]|uniref:Aste57867_16854 protein n=1 Tax=Aphanomyces stellatus TaxID=120398 RepID=A0A485L7Y8_9STRA|nr:hypothetical protein As57867_016796 [Aphanomyces stellatus]VFT93618.1 Aste57867_16854 [Aphanomyces stellatus]
MEPNTPRLVCADKDMSFQRDAHASPTHVEAFFEVAPPSPPRLRVHFATATTFLFDVAYGGSALPKETGPPIGMASTHIGVVEEDLTTHMRCRRGRVRKFDHLERIAMLKAADYHVQDIASFCMDAIDVRKSRQATLDEVHAERRREKRKLEGEDDEAAGRTTSKPRMFDPAMMGDRDDSENTT